MGVRRDYEKGRNNSSPWLKAVCSTSWIKFIVDYQTAPHRSWARYVSRLGLT
ncbi:hypothetical protein BDV38DRAFT_246280 [Aspergillus pseudotamarii]|uniref:Uncharacterized protein n=1 Tax=Aspergillus pseudotamarii TaxID=132259 RepID=A0A5N6SXJ7_ASPPS|nr:uncharacterized protein BDV38DRAFT_246280 [Aspergillus pseudotamarii]KAE8137844.1 hypothetical protein BDV38DRAFT_246280 [Aspergillus pseudotamarii]